jgi:hypothetical protein
LFLTVKIGLINFLAARSEETQVAGLTTATRPGKHVYTGSALCPPLMLRSIQLVDL